MIVLAALVLLASCGMVGRAAYGSKAALVIAVVLMFAGFKLLAVALG